jgi:hypothetical protein
MQTRFVHRRLHGDSPGITYEPFASSTWSTVGDPLLETINDRISSCTHVRIDVQI